MVLICKELFVTEEGSRGRWMYIGGGSFCLKDTQEALIDNMYLETQWQTTAPQMTKQPPSAITAMNAKYLEGVALSSYCLASRDILYFRMLWNTHIGGFDKYFGSWPWDFVDTYMDKEEAELLEKEYGIRNIRMYIYITGEPCGEVKVTV